MSVEGKVDVVCDYQVLPRKDSLDTVYSHYDSKNGTNKSLDTEEDDEFHDSKNKDIRMVWDYPITIDSKWMNEWKTYQNKKQKSLIKNEIVNI